MTEHQNGGGPVSERPQPKPVPGARPGGAVGPETVERFGRQLRHFPVAVSADAMALAWANKEDGPSGATVVVDHEVGARGLHGSLWTAAPADTLVCAVVLRPQLSVEEGDVSWLLAALAAAEGAEAVTGQPMSTWWPDTVVTGSEREAVAAVKAEVQLGPGQVKSVVVAQRFDLAKLGLERERRDDLLEAFVGALDRATEQLQDGAAGVVAAYEKRCAVLGQRVKLLIRPKGETRGTARRIDRSARLEVESPSGMIERVGLDQLKVLSVV
jgi:biotin-(acetyl-CoA carboxylase) ligase